MVFKFNLQSIIYRMKEYERESRLLKREQRKKLQKEKEEQFQ